MSLWSPSDGQTGMVLDTEELIQFDKVKANYFTSTTPLLTLTYIQVPSVHTNPQDWIGLFPLPWQHTRHPLVFTWSAPRSRGKKKKKKRTKDEDRRQVLFPLEDISRPSNKDQRYQFVYVSKSGSVLGKSRTFSIQGEEAWNLVEDEEFPQLSPLKDGSSTLTQDSEISILSPSQADAATESPVLLSYPSDTEFDLKNDDDDDGYDDDDDDNHAGKKSDDNSDEDWEITNGNEEDKEEEEREPGTSELSDIEILSTSPSQHDVGMTSQTSTPTDLIPDPKIHAPPNDPYITYCGDISLLSTAIDSMDDISTSSTKKREKAKAKTRKNGKDKKHEKSESEMLSMIFKRVGLNGLIVTSCVENEEAVSESIMEQLMIVNDVEEEEKEEEEEEEDDTPCLIEELFVGSDPMRDMKGKKNKKKNKKMKKDKPFPLIVEICSQDNPVDVGNEMVNEEKSTNSDRPEQEKVSKRTSRSNQNDTMPFSGQVKTESTVVAKKEKRVGHTDSHSVVSKGNTSGFMDKGEHFNRKPDQGLKTEKIRNIYADITRIDVDLPPVKKMKRNKKNKNDVTSPSASDEAATASTGVTHTGVNTHCEKDTSATATILSNGVPQGNVITTDILNGKQLTELNKRTTTTMISNDVMPLTENQALTVTINSKPKSEEVLGRIKKRTGNDRKGTLGKTQKGKENNECLVKSEKDSGEKLKESNCTSMGQDRVIFDEIINDFGRNSMKCNMTVHEVKEGASKQESLKSDYETVKTEIRTDVRSGKGPGNNKKLNRRNKKTKQFGKDQANENDNEEPEPGQCADASVENETPGRIKSITNDDERQALDTCLFDVIDKSNKVKTSEKKTKSLGKDKKRKQKVQTEIESREDDEIPITKGMMNYNKEKQLNVIDCETTPKKIENKSRENAHVEQNKSKEWNAILVSKTQPKNSDLQKQEEEESLVSLVSASKCKTNKQKSKGKKLKITKIEPVMSEEDDDVTVSEATDGRYIGQESGVQTLECGLQADGVDKDCYGQKDLECSKVGQDVILSYESIQSIKRKYVSKAKDKLRAKVKASLKMKSKRERCSRVKAGKVVTLGDGKLSQSTTFDVWSQKPSGSQDVGICDDLVNVTQLGNTSVTSEATHQQTQEGNVKCHDQSCNATAKKTGVSILSKMCSSNDTTSPTSSTSTRRPAIPAYLLDIMDALPETPDTPNLLHWRKAMARQKGKYLINPSKADTKESTAIAKGKKRAFLDKKLFFGAGMTKGHKLAPECDTSENVNVDVKHDIHDVQPASPKPLDSLMTYAGVLKGSGCSGENTEPTPKNSSQKEEGLEENVFIFTAIPRAVGTKARLIGARRSVFSDLSDLNESAIEAQCYLLDKTEDKYKRARVKLVTSRAQDRLRSKLKASRQKQMVKNRREKATRNEENCTTSLMPRQVSKTSSLVEDSHILSWPYPAVIVSTTSYMQSSLHNGLAWKHKDVDIDHHTGGSREKSRCHIGQGSVTDPMLMENGGGSAEHDNREEKTGTMSFGQRQKASWNQELPPTMFTARLAIETLHSEVETLERNVVSLENTVNCLRQLVKKQTKKKTKADLKMINMRKKYNCIKMSRMRTKESGLELDTSPSVESSRNDLVAKACCWESDERKGQAKRRTLEDDWSSSGKEARKSLPTQVTIKSQEANTPVDGCNTLYPNIQKELKQLQQDLKMGSHLTHPCKGYNASVCVDNTHATCNATVNSLNMYNGHTVSQGHHTVESRPPFVSHDNGLSFQHQQMTSSKDSSVRQACFKGPVIREPVDRGMLSKGPHQQFFQSYPIMPPVHPPQQPYPVHNGCPYDRPYFPPNIAAPCFPMGRNSIQESPTRPALLPTPPQKLRFTCRSPNRRQDNSVSNSYRASGRSRSPTHVLDKTVESHAYQSIRSDQRSMSESRTCRTGQYCPKASLPKHYPSRCSPYTQYDYLHPSNKDVLPTNTGAYSKEVNRFTNGSPFTLYFQQHTGNTQNDLSTCQQPQSFFPCQNSCLLYENQIPIPNSCQCCCQSRHYESRFIEQPFDRRLKTTINHIHSKSQQKSRERC